MALDMREESAMKKNPYLTDLNDPDDCIEKFVDFDRDAGFIKERMNLIVEILEPKGTHELTYSTFYKGDYAGYHMAKFGCESMIVGPGEMEVIVRGKKTLVHEGDVMHFGVYNEHEMYWTQDTPWVGFFHNMNICAPARNKKWAADHNPEMNDKDFADVFSATYDSIGLEGAMSIAPEVDKSEIAEIRDKDFALDSFEREGLLAEQKIGRWETEGMYEYWRLTMKKGFFAESSKLNPRGNVYYIQKGSVHFKIYDEEFDAFSNNIVFIPEYSKYRFTVNEDDSVMYDMYNSCLTHNLVNELNTVKALYPEKLKDKDYVESLKEKYCCYITASGVLN